MEKQSAPFITIAVLPFENISRDKELQVFCDGFSFDLVTELSHFSQFQIICIQTTSASYNGDKKETLPYDTDYFIRGSFRSYGDKVRINAQLTDAGTDRLIWADRFVDSLDSLFSIQDELQQRLVASLQEHLHIDLLRNVRKKKATRLKAYEYWLYGLNELKKGSVPSDDRAREYFQKALEIDPHYSLAHSGMSLSYFNEWSCQLWNRWDISRKGAKEWAEKALEIDEQNYIANLVVGKIYLFERQFGTSEVFLRKALKLNPNDPFNLIQIALCFIYLGFLDEAESLYNKALFLNPIGEESYHPTGALIYFEKGDYQKCLDIGGNYTDIGWVDFPALIAAANYYIGNEAESVKLWQRYLRFFEEKIAKSRENLEYEALRWIMEINPYNYKSNFGEFWQFIGKATLEIPELAIAEKTLTQIKKNLFKKEGEIWTFTFHGNTAQLPDIKGLSDIAGLLTHPNEQIHCSKLIGSALIERTDKMIDEKAKKAYQERILGLQQDISIAEENNDPERLNALREEYDHLLQHLYSSLDIRGRSRNFRQSGDKARSAVTQRIRNSIRKMEKVHPELAKHLDTSIKTGTYCSYSPEQEIDWIL